MVRAKGAWVRPGLVVLLGFVALLGQSIPTLLPQAQEFLAVGGLETGGGADLVEEGGGDVGLSAGESPADDGEDLAAEGRNVTVEIRGGDVDIALESNASDGGDEVNLQFGSVAAELRVSFQTLVPQQEEVEMRIVFRDLVEFEDRDGDGAFSLLHDEVLQWVSVEDLQMPTNPEQGDFLVDSIVGHRVNVSYVLPGSGTGTFDLIFSVFGFPTPVDGLILGPTETKIDIRFMEFPFTSETSQLALGLDVKTTFGLELDPSLAFDQINAAGDDFAAFFRWMPDAVYVDGNASKAEVTLVRESTTVDMAGIGDPEEEVRLFLAYPRGAEIVHDPVVGITGVDFLPPLVVPVPSLAAYAIGLATAVLLVVGLYALHRRRS